MTKKKDMATDEALTEFEKDNPEPFDSSTLVAPVDQDAFTPPVPPQHISEPPPPPVGREWGDAVQNRAAQAYETYIKQLSVRARPSEPLTYAALDIEHKKAWLAALSGEVLE